MSFSQLTAVGLFLVVISLFLPMRAQASFFSSLFGKSAQADSSEISGQSSNGNSQNIALADPAQVSLQKDAGTKSGDITIEKGALAAELGPLGTSADIGASDIPTSDQILLYVVKKGDSIPIIAAMLGVSSNTIRFANNLSSSASIKEGQTLLILPITGIEYTIKKGDTLKSIAAKYKADADEIGQFNGIEGDSKLIAGTDIIIPDAEAPTVVVPKASSAGTSKIIPGNSGADLGGYYLRPISGGHRTTGIHGKNAVDIGAPKGTPILAAADGVVIVADAVGYNGGYGEYVALSHPNGTQTVYGHMSKVLVTPGESVVRGQTIGLVGTTGKSTGTHLHFEVHGAKNPLGDNPNYGL